MSEKTTTSNAIGIDLGTTFSCVGAYINGKIEIITNPDGDRTTPSIVAFGEAGNVVVGNAAKNMYSNDPSSVIFDAKRMIGRGFDEDQIQKCISKWPFKIVRYNFQTKKEETSPALTTGENKITDNIAIKVERNGKVEYYAPIEISARVLTYMKKAAEARLGTKVDSAVITVPAYFQGPQKKKTKEAGIIAGFKSENIRLVPEPTAAAMAYAHLVLQTEGKVIKNENVFVFDLGGGTFDVSVLDFEYNTETGSVGISKATDGNTFLGGQDFDNLLIQHSLAEFKKKNPTVNESEYKPNALARLRAEVTRVKANLSSTTNSQIFVPCFHGTTDLNISITRTRFEFLCESLFKSCMERVKGCLLQSEGYNVKYSEDGSKLLLTADLEKKLEEVKKGIHKVIPVGGSSRIPKIKSMLCDFFGSAKIIEPVNPDEAIAYGAAFQAATVFTEATSKEGTGLLLVDCCPLDLSIETAGGIATVLIPRNQNIPTKKTETFTTYADNQTAVTINVYEGNRGLAKENNLIGSFNLDGIIAAPRGVPQIEVTFDVDADGVLQITAHDKQTDKKSSLTVSNTQSRLSDAEILKMKQAAEEHEKADEQIKNLIAKKNGFESVLNSFKSAIQQHKDFPQEKKDEITERLRPYEEWVLSIDGANYDENELNQKDQEVKDLIKEYMPAGAAPTA